jgi:hypothetical protein
MGIVHPQLSTTSTHGELAFNFLIHRQLARFFPDSDRLSRAGAGSGMSMTGDQRASARG